MTSTGGRWDDLRTRLISGGAMALAGIAFVALGGWWFAALAAAVTGIMIWEVGRMLGIVPAVALGCVSGAVILLARLLPDMATWPLVLAPVAVGIGFAVRDRVRFGLYALAIMIAGWGLVSFRDEHGVVWLFWLVIVVVATDVFGYFGGKALGGPKFWPSLSPKKTWAGIVSGWVAAVLVGAVFLSITTAGRDLLWISALLSFASQLGDIAQSALKRHAGVKDSSSLLPGHGGLYDRFDGLLGAALFMMMTALIVDVPRVAF